MNLRLAHPLTLSALVIALLFWAAPIHTAEAATRAPVSPSALIPSPDGALLYVASHTGDRVLIIDGADGKVTGSIQVPLPPTGLALTKDGHLLFVTCAGSESQVCVIDTRERRITHRLDSGHTALAPVLSQDESRLYVCNRFNNEVVVHDLEQNRQFHIPVDRQPVAAALTPDSKLLFVANHLHNTAATARHVAAVVSVIDTSSLQVVKEIPLTTGSGLLLGVAISPDGRHAAVTHNIARFHVPTMQLDRGWMNTAALTLIDVPNLEVINTVLLDNVDRGAANPWAVAWTEDGTRLVVTHAGTHELSIIDAPTLVKKLASLPAKLAAGTRPDSTRASNVASDVPNDLAFLVGLRKRVPLAGNGPRSLALVKQQAWVGNYFSDTVERVDLGDQPGTLGAFPLSDPVGMSAMRRGEMAFNDASLCFQGWQSCASCHSCDGRVDALNWDLLNDGIGNPKNSKSLLLTFDTPPAMSLAVRETSGAAVRAGIRHILFTVQPDEVAGSLDEYIKSLEPMPSPLLVDGKLSAPAQRGRMLFEDSRVGCASCHPPGLFTDLKSYDVGTGQFLDQGKNTFDTPTLVEAWRTAPYLHDGSAATLRDTLTRHNAHNRHGRTSHLTDEQIDDLATYVLSL